MIQILENNIPLELFKNPVWLYGAGYTARVCMTALIEKGIKITGLIDDDPLKWGRKVDRYTVYSYEQFEQYMENENICIVLTSIYGKTILQKLTSHIKVYQMYNWYSDLLNIQENAIKKSCSKTELAIYKKETEKIYKDLSDNESILVLKGIYEYYNSMNITIFENICTTEDSYFIEPVKKYFENKEVTIVDAGAYEGELLRSINISGIHVKNWFCFELDRHNYSKMLDNLHKETKVSYICENKGVWNEKCYLPICGSGTGTKVDDIHLTSAADYVEMITIDEYFEKIPIDMIKMDIEGAEYNAVKGAINVIKRDRPVLAISIYHDVRDYYRIIDVLLHEDLNYSYYIRQHALIYGETVLYAIPR